MGSSDVSFFTIGFDASEMDMIFSDNISSRAFLGLYPHKASRSIGESWVIQFSATV